MSESLATWTAKRGTGLHLSSRENHSKTPTENTTTRPSGIKLAHQYIFETIEEVQEAATAWLWTYNNEQPNMVMRCYSLQELDAHVKT